MTDPEAARSGLRLGTRGSALARWQTEHVAALLRAHHPHLTIETVVISTRGDRVLDTPLPLIGGKGLFTQELERALLSGEIDCAVHSLKDLPTGDAAGLVVGAVPQRGPAGDALIAQNNDRLDTLPPGATVGTSSRRRAAQLRHYRRDLQILDIRGNVETRMRKALDPEGPYLATVLARAGLERLELAGTVSQMLDYTVMLPAPGQGALAVQCRQDEEILALLRPIEDHATRVAVTAERAFLAALEGGCSLPVAALAHVDGEMVHLRGRVSAVDGGRQIDVEGSANLAAAAQLGRDTALRARRAGADRILADVVAQENQS